MNEWELLVSAEDIKKGDIIIIETENGHTQAMKLVKWTDKYVILRNHIKELIKFRSDNLESEDDDGLTIIGKKV